MNTAETRDSRKEHIICDICSNEIGIGNAYHNNNKILCEECCIDVRIPLLRKSHWQYLGSIKSDYIIPAKRDR